VVAESPHRERAKDEHPGQQGAANHPEEEGVLGNEWGPAMLEHAA